MVVSGSRLYLVGTLEGSKVKVPKIQNKLEKTRKKNQGKMVILN
jgi:hypothetical protein